MTVTSALTNVSSSHAATRQIAAFRKQFGEGHFYLACHAALPLALNPDLLYCLWANFQRDIHGRSLEMPWIAVADLLLSGLCEPVGCELYEIDAEIQKELMLQLQQDPCFGQERIRELADFVVTYVAQQLESPDLDMQDFARGQKWRAVAHTNPAEAAHSIATELAQISLTDSTEWIRMAALLETLATPLANYPSLLVYAAAMADFLRGKEAEAAAKFRQILGIADRLQVAGVNLPVPAKIVSTQIPPVPPSNQFFLTHFLRQYYRQLIVGVVATGSLIGVIFSLPNSQNSPTKTVSSVTFSPSRSSSVAPLLLATLGGHQATVSSVAFSPDGKTIASGSGDNTVRLWDLQGQPIGQPFQGHQASVYSVAFSPDGKTIASGSWDNTVRLWDLQGQPIGQPFQGHQSPVNSVAFSPDGKTIASGSNDNTVRLWDLQGQPIGQPFQGRQFAVYSVAFSPDGKTIASGGWDNTVRLWDLQGQPIGQPFQEHQSPVYSVAFSPDGKTIASGSTDKTVRLWDLQGQPIGQPFQGHQASVWSVAFSPDGKTIASGSADNTVRLWGLQGQPIGQPFQGHQASVWSVAFSLDGKTIASGSGDSTVKLWKP